MRGGDLREARPWGQAETDHRRRDFAKIESLPDSRGNILLEFPPLCMEHIFVRSRMIRRKLSC